jgi:hypothetical protein
MNKEEIIEMAKKCGWDNPATNMAPLYEFAKLVAEKATAELRADVKINQRNLLQKLTRGQE